MIKDDLKLMEPVVFWEKVLVIKDDLKPMAMAPVDVLMEEQEVAVPATYQPLSGASADVVSLYLVISCGWGKAVALIYELKLNRHTGVVSFLSKNDEHLRHQIFQSNGYETLFSLTSFSAVSLGSKIYCMSSHHEFDSDKYLDHSTLVFDTQSNDMICEIKSPLSNGRPILMAAGDKIYAMEDYSQNRRLNFLSQYFMCYDATLGSWRQLSDAGIIGYPNAFRGYAVIDDVFFLVSMYDREKKRYIFFLYNLKLDDWKPVQLDEQTGKSLYLPLADKAVFVKGKDKAMIYSYSGVFSIVAYSVDTSFMSSWSSSGLHLSPPKKLRLENVSLREPHSPLRFSGGLVHVGQNTFCLVSVLNSTPFPTATFITVEISAGAVKTLCWKSFDCSYKGSEDCYFMPRFSCCFVPSSTGNYTFSHDSGRKKLILRNTCSYLLRGL